MGVSVRKEDFRALPRIDASRSDLRDLGITAADLRAIGDGDQWIDGTAELDQLFDRLRALDAADLKADPGRRQTLDRATALYRSLKNAAPLADPVADDLDQRVAKLVDMPLGAADKKIVSLQKYLDGYDAALASKADGHYPKGVDHHAYDRGRALVLQGFTRRELELYLVYGDKHPEVAARLNTVNEQFRTEGEWTAQNAVAALYEMRESSVRAHREQARAQKAELETARNALPTDSEDRTAIQGKIDELDKKIAAAKTALEELETSTHKLHSTGRRARLSYGQRDLKKADELDAEAAALDKKGDAKGAAEARADAKAIRDRGKATLYSSGKHLDQFIEPLEKAGKIIPEWMKKEQQLAYDGAAYAQIVDAQRDTQKLKDDPLNPLVTAGEPQKLGGTAADVTGAKRGDKIPGARALSQRVEQIHPDAKKDQGHLAVVQQGQTALFDFHKLGAERAGFFSEDWAVNRLHMPASPGGVVAENALSHATAMYAARRELEVTLGTRVELYGDVNKLGWKDQNTVGGLNAQLGDIAAQKLAERHAAVTAARRLLSLENSKAGTEKSIGELAGSAKETQKNIDAAKKRFGPETIDTTSLDSNLKINAGQAGDVQYTAALNHKGVADRLGSVFGKKLKDLDAQRVDAQVQADAKWQVVKLANPYATIPAAADITQEYLDVYALDIADYTQISDVYYEGASHAYGLAQKNFDGTAVEKADLDKTVGFFNYSYAGYLATSAGWQGLDASSDWKKTRSDTAHTVFKAGEKYRAALPPGSEGHVAASQSAALTRASLSQGFVDVDPRAAKEDFVEGRKVVAEDIRPYDLKSADAIDVRLGGVALANLDILDQQLIKAVKAGRLNTKLLKLGDEFLRGARAVVKTVDASTDGVGVLNKNIEKWDAEFSGMKLFFTVAKKQWENGAALAVARGRSMTDHANELIDKSNNEIGLGLFMILSGGYHLIEAGVKWDSSELEIDNPQGDKRAIANQNFEQLHDTALSNRNMGTGSLDRLENAWDNVYSGKIKDVGPIEYLWSLRIATAAKADVPALGSTHANAIANIDSWGKGGHLLSAYTKRDMGHPPVFDVFLTGGSSRVSQALELYGDARIPHIDRGAQGGLNGVSHFYDEVADRASWAAPLNSFAETFFVAVATLGFGEILAIGRGAQIGVGLAEGAGGANAALQVGSLARMATNFGRMLAVNAGTWAVDKATQSIFGADSAVSKVVGFGLNFVDIAAAQRIAGVKSVIGAVVLAEAQMGATSYLVPWTFSKLGWEDKQLAMELTGLVVGALIPVGAAEIMHARAQKMYDDRAQRLVDQVHPRGGKEKQTADVARALSNYHALAGDRIPSSGDTRALKAHLGKLLGVEADNAHVSRMVDRMQVEAAAGHAARDVTRGSLDENAAPGRGDTMKLVSETAGVLERANPQAADARAAAMQKAADHWALGLYAQANDAALAGKSEATVQSYLDAAHAASDLGAAARISGATGTDGKKLLADGQRPAAEAILASELGRARDHRGTLPADHWARVEEKLTADPKLGGAGLDAATAKVLAGELRAAAFGDAVKSSLFSHDGLVDALVMAPKKDETHTERSARFIESKAKEAAARLRLSGAEADAMVAAAKKQFAASHAESVQIFGTGHASEAAKHQTAATAAWMKEGKLSRAEITALNELSPAALRAMQEVGARQAADAVAKYSPALIERLAPALGGSRLHDLAAAGMSRGKLERLANQYPGEALRVMLDDVGPAALSRFMNEMSDAELGTFHRELGAALGKLSDLSVPELRKMMNTYGWNAMRWASAELNGAGAKRMLGELGTRARADQAIAAGVSTTRAAAAMKDPLSKGTADPFVQAQRLDGADPAVAQALRDRVRGMQAKEASAFNALLEQQMSRVHPDNAGDVARLYSNLDAAPAGRIFDAIQLKPEAERIASWRDFGRASARADLVVIDPTRRAAAQKTIAEAAASAKITHFGDWVHHATWQRRGAEPAQQDRNFRDEVSELTVAIAQAKKLGPGERVRVGMDAKPEHDAAGNTLASFDLRIEGPKRKNVDVYAPLGRVQHGDFGDAITHAAKKIIDGNTSGVKAQQHTFGRVEAAIVISWPPPVNRTRAGDIEVAANGDITRVQGNGRRERDGNFFADYVSILNGYDGALPPAGASRVDQLSVYDHGGKELYRYVRLKNGAWTGSTP